MQVVDADTGRPFLQYVAGNPEGDPAATAAAVKAGKASGLPVLVYWPRPQPSVWIPQADVIGIEAYQLAGESAAAFKNRIGAACKAVGRAVLIAQAYTSNTSNASNLEPLAALYGQLAIEHSNVEGILAFSAGGRATGWDDHPEIWAGWQALFAGITAPHLAPVVTPQPKPTPKPTPTPAPIPVPPQELPDMNLPARCYVLLHNSNIAACAPGQAAVDLNHSPQEYGAWQEVEIVKSKEWAADNPRVIVRFVSANRILRVDKVAAGLRKYDQCVQTWSPDASDADSSWQQGIAAGPFIHYTSDSTDGSRHGVVYTVTCVDGSGKLFR
jgi:hypothetical protein